MKRLFFCLILLLPFASHAQKQWNVWYFGVNAGLNFSSGTPVPLTNGAINAMEGCASVSDKNTGNFLFSTDGVSVYNKNNIAMPNGNGLGGSHTSTQAALIVPKPRTDSMYYIFTTGGQAGYDRSADSGLDYSIVDLRLNNGLGAVTVKRQQLVKSTAEKLCGAYACNGSDIWVATHQWGTDAFYAYLVTDTGISLPVISHAGIVYSDDADVENFAATGYMKISPNGKKLALVTGIESDVVQIFDFDNIIGAISNPITDNYPNPGSFDKPYGLSFSPDNSKLYVSYFQASPVNSLIYQYNLLAGDSNAIKGSRTTVGVVSNGYRFALQAGPDGKIYVCDGNNGSSLDVINNPNELGLACNYTVSSLSLGGKACGLGLPNIIENYSSGLPAINILPASPTICAGQGIKLTASGGSGNYTWRPSAGLSATTGSEVIANPAVTTTYMVIMPGNSGCEAVGVNGITVIPTPFISFSYTINGQQVSFTPDSSGGGVTSYSWDFGDSSSTGTDISPVHTYSKNDIHNVCLTVYNNSNCSYTFCKNVDLTATPNKGLTGMPELQLYPNPVGETLMVTGNIIQGSSLQVINVLGQTVLTMDNLQRTNQAGIDVHSLTPGVYLLQYKSNSGNVVKWFVKK